MYALQEQTAMSGTAGTDGNSICDQTPENTCVVDRPDARPGPNLSVSASDLNKKGAQRPVPPHLS